MPKILLLEDDPGDAELVLLTLKRAALAYEHRCVDNESAFKSALDTFHPDIVLSDYNLPSYTGLEALNHVRSTFPDLPVIMVTGALGEERATELLRKGANDFVLKDRLSRLPDAVQRALTAAQQHAEKLAFEEKLKESELLLSQAEAIAHLGSWLWDLKDDKIHYSDEAFNIFGIPNDHHPHAAEEFIQNLVVAEDRDSIRNNLRATCEGDTPCDCEIRIKRPNGEIRWLQVRAKRIHGESNTTQKLIGTFLDITERQATKVALENNHNLLRMALEGAHESVWEWDLMSGTMKFQNDFYTMLGYRSDEFPPTHKAWLSLIHFDDRESFTRQFAEGASRRKDMFVSDIRMLSKDGRYRWLQVRGRGTNFDPHGNPAMVVGICIDIDENKRKEQKVSFLAYHDKLTGLPNRYLFLDRFSHAISQAARDSSKVALLFIDLDGFKNINDDYGHEVGDEVLIQSAQRFMTAIREADTVVRYGGDEFAIILNGLSEKEQAGMVAQKLLKAFESKMPIAENSDCQVGVSIGISLFPNDGLTMDGLLNAADQAMYQSKKSGKNRYSYFDPQHMSGHDWFTLPESHLTGIFEIDEQHRNLIGKINDFHRAWLEQQDPERQMDRFSDFVNAVKEHFDNEERYMSQSGYAELDKHSQAHGHQFAELVSMQTRLNEGEILLVAYLLKDWLLNHILVSDKSLGEFLANSGMR